MALPQRRVPRRALTASAAKLSSQRAESYSQRMSMPWQRQALSYYDMIGEFRYAAQFYARMMSRVTFFPARVQDDGKTERITSGPAVDLFNRIQDPGGGRERLQFDYGRLMWITGEGYLFGYNLESPAERWKFLWKDEMKILPGGVAVRIDANQQETSERGVAYRMWTPHPRRSDEADSPMRPVRDIAEELIILTDSVRSTAVTRMTKGILVLPTEISPSPDFVEGDEDSQTNPFLEDFKEHITNQKENAGTAAAAAPFLFEGAYDYLDRVQWIETHNPATDFMEQKLREECIQRASIAFDMPPEALRGMADANHWTAKQVMQDMWRSHGVPVAERFGDDLADAYLQPALIEGGMDEEEARLITVSYDDSQVVISPDRAEQATEALQWGGIGYESYRKTLGYDEADKPTEDDLQLLLSLRSRQPIEAVQAFEEGTNAVAPQRGPLPTPTSRKNAANGPPSPTNGRAGSRQEAMRASIWHGAALMALRRCRDVAGARLRRQQQRCDECLEQTDGKPNGVVAAILGMEKVSELGVENPLSLVADGACSFRDLLVDEGCDPTQAEALKMQLEIFAAKTLFQEWQPEIPSALIAAIQRAEEMTDALHPAQAGA